MKVSKTRLSVSIVIPAHNEERHLKACLEAIASQTLAPLEVIVVDNNSTDNTVKIAKKFKFVRVVTEDQQGIVYARNAGFDQAKGDIIGRIDADIQLPQNWVEHITNYYDDEDRADTAWSGKGYFYNVRLPGLVSWTYGQFAFGLNRLLVGHYTLWGSNMAITQAQWCTIRSDVCLRTDIHEDLDLAMHLNDMGYEIVYDTSIQTNAELRRVHTDRGKLWDYLQWWPRTLRIHERWTWVICWIFGALMLYLAAFFLVAVDYFARKLLNR